ncbi:hypothetical protein GCM10009639_50320 [Kitasatospora putterlickiae]|uniref:Uncharacterized protein n=1 Tax=Kitasatospora putterlickiae TaxID=221725 RepID=A0ABN1YEC8_9ACTN
MQTWGERYQQGLTDSAERERRARADAAALRRRGWARGENVQWTPLTVTTPDGRLVGLRVVRVGSGPPAADVAGKPGARSDLLVGVLGLLALLAEFVAVLMLLGLAVQWLFVELTGRPRWAVVATADGVPLTVQRTRRREQALIAAAALADRLEREGTAALYLPAPAIVGSR